MSEPTLPDQETATLHLLMNREIDKRVMIALSRALNPGNNWEEREFDRAYDCNHPGEIQRVARSMLITALMSDGSLMNQIRNKIGESLQRARY